MFLTLCSRSPRGIIESCPAGFEDLGFVPRGEAGTFIAERSTAPGANLKLPLNTNGGGLSYCIPACMACTRCKRACARYAAPPQISGARISVCHGVGGMFAASGTVIMSNEALRESAM
jgi:acetyl-CoA acetyltransferase